MSLTAELATLKRNQLGIVRMLHRLESKIDLLMSDAGVELPARADASEEAELSGDAV